MWVTYDSMQSRSLLLGEEVIFAHYSGPRDVKNVIKNLSLAHRLLRKRRFSMLISTGAQIALSFFPIARLFGVECHFIESAARVEGPSLTGKLLRAIPGIRYYPQYYSPRFSRSLYRGCVFDGFCLTGRKRPSRSIKKVFVTLGILKGYRFQRLIERVRSILAGKNVDVLWQTCQRDAMETNVFNKVLRSADVVIAHAGVGAALSSFQAGKCPVLVPRLRARGEHVDDHQLQIATMLSSSGLAVYREADELCFGDLILAASSDVGRRPEKRPFVLDSLLNQSE